MVLTLSCVLTKIIRPDRSGLNMTRKGWRAMTDEGEGSLVKRQGFVGP
jgi:hypothetical protein